MLEPQLLQIFIVTSEAQERMCLYLISEVKG